MSYEEKYIKYKTKYLELKKQIELEGGQATYDQLRRWYTTVFYWFLKNHSMIATRMTRSNNSHKDDILHMINKFSNTSVENMSSLSDSERKSYISFLSNFNNISTDDESDTTIDKIINVVKNLIHPVENHPLANSQITTKK